MNRLSGQVIATSHDLGPQKVAAREGKFPYPKLPNTESRE